MDQDGHRIIRLFLASSIGDTELERDKLQIKIMNVWNPIFRSFGAELELFRCEQMEEGWPERNQDKIDERIRNADVFILIFKNTVGRYTFHELEVAHDHWNKSGTPHIYPYISDELIRRKDEIEELQVLTQENHYPETFTAYEAIEVSLLERLGRELTLNVQLHKNGSVTVNGQKEEFSISQEEVSKAFLLRQKAYMDFSVQMLKPRFRDLPLVSYLGQEFPDCVLEAAKDARAFDVETMCFALSDHSTLLRGPTEPVSPETQQWLKSCCGREMKFPYLFYQYMNDAFIQDGEGKISGVQAYVAPAPENIISTIALYHEMETLYQEKQRGNEAEIEENSPVRRMIEQKAGAGTESLLKGQGRSSGLGIQLVVLFPVSRRSARSIAPEFLRYAGKGHYWTPMVRRSDDATEQPGFYQFAPCGNFLLFNEPEAAGRDRNVQRRQFDFFQAILHHYVRELFNDAPAGAENRFGSSSFDRPEHAVMYDKATVDPHAEELYDMLEDGNAALEFLGCSSSLAALKSDLVFLLKIDDEGYFDRNHADFKSDFVAASLRPYPLEYLEQPDFLEGENCLAQEIAGPLALLKKSDCWEEIRGSMG